MSCNPHHRLVRHRDEECPPRDIVDDAIAEGVEWIAHAYWLHEQELVEACSGIRLAVTVVLAREECELPDVIKAAAAKAFTNCKRAYLPYLLYFGVMSSQYIQLSLQ